MYLNQAKKHIDKLLQLKTPVFLWGSPGIGKSSVVKQLAEEHKWGLIDLRLSLLNPVDLRGLPFFDEKEKEAVWLRPEFLPTEAKHGKEGILFLDELNTAPTSVQIAAYQLVLDRAIGNYVMPDGWRIVAAGNRESDAAMVSKMPSPLANRLIHLQVDANIEDWKEWARNKVDSKVMGFLNFKPKLLVKVPKAEEKAYPTPRSWSYVSDIVKIYSDPHDAEDIIAGAVGEGPSKEFLAFVDVYSKLPDIDGILQGKVTKVPTGTDVLYALCAALLPKMKAQYIDNFLKYIFNMPPEFATLAVKDVAKGGWENEIQASKNWEKWVAKHHDLIVDED
ncbi:MAG: hypothetical protein KCHDKBKB_00745 [Elusimicrobia bacterium]|nr:hypothetical protein [Elusimicrobiota bacterium]